MVGVFEARGRRSLRVADVMTCVDRVGLGHAVRPGFLPFFFHGRNRTARLVAPIRLIVAPSPAEKVAENRRRNRAPSTKLPNRAGPPAIFVLIGLGQYRDSAFCLTTKSRPGPRFLDLRSNLTLPTSLRSQLLTDGIGPVGRRKAVCGSRPSPVPGALVKKKKKKKNKKSKKKQKNLNILLAFGGVVAQYTRRPR